MMASAAVVPLAIVVTNDGCCDSDDDERVRWCRCITRSTPLLMHLFSLGRQKGMSFLPLQAMIFCSHGG
jgi:hypothetical protein